MVGLRGVVLATKLIGTNDITKITNITGIVIILAEIEFVKKMLERFLNIWRIILV